MDGVNGQTFGWTFLFKIYLIYIYTELNKNNANDIECFNVKKSLKIPKSKTEAVNQRKIDNTMTKWMGSTDTRLAQFITHI